MVFNPKLTAPKNYVTGKYAVGTTSFSLTDTGRKEVLGSAKGDRKIEVRMYYPTDPAAVADKKHAPILSEPKKAAILKAFHLRNMSNAFNTAEFYADAPIAEDRTFPLVMFSMGYNSYVESNTYLLCALVSHGYIVASVGHAFEGVVSEYEDGSTDLFDKTINKRMYTSMFGALIRQGKLLRTQMDFQEALTQFEAFQNQYTPYIQDRVPQWEQDILKALAAVKERYAAHLDLSRGIGASGHSLGGCLAYYLCRYHAEFCCGINIDGGLFGHYPDSIMEKPFCQISCRENLNVETRPYLHTNADTYQVLFDDMKHMGFTDAKFYIPIRSLAGKLDSEEMLKHLIYCHTAFFDRYLKGTDTAFQGLPSEKVTYRKIC